jgi:Ca2+-transporting ATPase
MNSMRQKGFPRQKSGRFGQWTRRVWHILFPAIKKFSRIYGAQWAGAFAFNAFFSLFPLVVLLVTIASFFVDRDRAGKEVIAHMESYVPISGEMQRQIFGTIAGVIRAREQAGAIAFAHPDLGRPPSLHHPHLRNQPRLGHNGV